MTKSEIRKAMIYKLKDGRELKKKLKEKFNHDFSVRRKGRWFRVDWEDGPAYDLVNKFCIFFDDTGKDEIETDLFVGSQYIILQRSISESGRRSLISLLSSHLHVPLEYADNESGGVRLADSQDKKSFPPHAIATEMHRLSAISSFEN